MIIYCKEEINKRYIEKNNIEPNDVIVIKNTVNQTSEGLSQIPPYIQINVIGGFDENKDSRYKTEIHKKRNTYSAQELSTIIGNFEKYEKEIDENWSDLAKALYIYVKLRQDMEYADEAFEHMYDPEYYDENADCNIRSLRGITRKKAVCAGFSQIYKEFMERQGIVCKYRAQHGIHAWNEVKINGQFYPVDLTLEIAEKNERLSLKYFMNNPNFYEEIIHKPDDDDECVSRVMERDTIQKAHLETFETRYKKFKDSQEDLQNDEIT